MSKYHFSIDGIEFTSKKAVLDHVKGIRSKYSDNQDLTPDDLRFMVALLGFHQWGDEKVGIGVRRMWMQLAAEYPTRAFWLERLDGSKTDFSFHGCLTNASPMRDFKSAARRAIAPVVINFRLEWFKQHPSPICPVLGCPMSIRESHVDHTPPMTFEKIISDFVEVNNLAVEKIPLVSHLDGVIGNEFADKVFEGEWLDWHNSHAVLRVISAEANLRRRND